MAEPVASAATLDDPHMVADFLNDGSAVFAVREELVTKLIEASPRRLQEIAEAWVPAVVADGTQIDVDAPDRSPA